MPVYIRSLLNVSAGLVVYGDAMSAQCWGIAPGEVGRPPVPWYIPLVEFQHCVLGKGAANDGPGTYDWIKAEGQWATNIYIVRAGQTFWQPLKMFDGWGDFPLDLAYDGFGHVVVREMPPDADA